MSEVKELKIIVRNQEKRIEILMKAMSETSGANGQKAETTDPIQV